MKKVSRILFLVGGIIGLCLGSLFLLLGVLFLIFSLPFFLDIVREGLQNGSISTTAKSVDAAVMIWQMTYTSLSISMFVMSVLGFIDAVLSFTSEHSQSISSVGHDGRQHRRHYYRRDARAYFGNGGDTAAALYLWDGYYYGHCHAVGNLLWRYLRRVHHSNPDRHARYAGFCGYYDRRSPVCRPG